jgi:protein TonB
MFARERHLEGAVVLRVLIAEDGAVRQVDIVHGDSMLAEAAVRAVRQWRYKPYQLNNRPVSTTIDVTINFKME